jgi:hypothetical protein
MKVIKNNNYKYKCVICKDYISHGRFCNKHRNRFRYYRQARKYINWTDDEIIKLIQKRRLQKEV